MSLNEVLAALSENDIQIEITKIITENNESEEVSIIEFEASGYEALNASLLAEEVDKIKVNKTSLVPSITILLK